MRQLKIPAAFVRGGTSNGIAFLKENLPPDRDDWKEIFLAAARKISFQSSRSGGRFSFKNAIPLLVPPRTNAAGIFNCLMINLPLTTGVSQVSEYYAIDSYTP